MSIAKYKVYAIIHLTNLFLFTVLRVAQDQEYEPLARLQTLEIGKAGFSFAS